MAARMLLRRERKDGLVLVRSLRWILARRGRWVLARRGRSRLARERANALARPVSTAHSTLARSTSVLTTL